MNWRRLTSKALFRLAGYLTHIKTPQTFYRVDSWDPFKTSPAGRHWTACRLSIKVLKMSSRLDWEHWDHWALAHTTCVPDRCPECGGQKCVEEYL